MNRRVKTIFALAFLGLAAIGLSSAQGQDALTVRHDLGETTIKERPRRIVAFSEEVVELLTALEAKPVGFTSQRVILRDLPGAVIGQPLEGITFPIASTPEGAAYLSGASNPHSRRSQSPNLT